MPIEERVFFREGKGVSATSDNYRVATEAEVCAWQELQHKLDEENSISSNVV